jgi:peptide/nickel transport system ATP-binding protein
VSALRVGETAAPRGAEAPELLRVEDLRVEYLTPSGDVRVVDDVSFSIREGECFGLAGESGSGKSTVAMAILRLLKPPGVISGGRVLWGGKDVLDYDDGQLRSFRWREVSLVMQSAMNALNPVITVGEQLCDVILAHEKVTPVQALERAAHLLKLVHIDASRLKSYPHELSGGMRRRVVIAMALALSPRLMIMDEPTTALDVVVQREILAQIAELRAKLGFAVLLVTHDLSLMLEFCTQVGVLYAGRLAELAPARQLIEKPQHPYTEALLASIPDPRRAVVRLQGIPGIPVDLRKPPEGCRFHPRCPRAFELCPGARPELTPLGPDHTASCHLFTTPPTVQP